MYWTNAGKPNWGEVDIVLLSGGTLANGIAVSGSDVYVSGSNSNGEAIYWKNGVIDTLGKGGATGIAVAQ